MRILFVTHSTLGEGGSLCQTATLGTVGALSKLGWDVTIVSTSKSFKDGKNIINGFDWHHVPLRKIPGMQSFLIERSSRNVVRKVLAGSTFDVAIINWSICRTVIPIIKDYNFPIIVDDRSPPVHESLIGKLQWLHYHFAWKYASTKGDGFSFNSLALKDMITNKYGLKKYTCFYPSATEPDKYTKSQLIMGDTMTLVYHGLMDKERSVFEIFEAAKKVLDEGVKVKLIMFGKGNDIGRLTKLSEENEWFELLPPCTPDKVPSRLSCAHIGILPLPDKYQWKFSSPLKLFEYAAAGLNVIATDIQCHRAIGARKWLKLIKTDQISTNIANEVLSIIKDREWEVNSKIAYEDAKNEFSWDNSVKSLNSLIHKVLNSTH